MKKLEFKDVYYDPATICWGEGNDIVGPQLLARIQIREPNKKENAKALKDYNEAKEIYDQHFELGQTFKASKEKTISNVEAKITYIHNEKQTVTWKQYNLSKEQIADGIKPARGRWSINAMIKLCMTGEIEFIHDDSL